MVTGVVSEPPLVTAAIAYAQRGWSVFPLQPGTKLPFPGTRGHLDASNDLAQVAKWWSEYPDANIGVSLEPSGLYVLDVDVSTDEAGNVAQGEASLATIDAQLTPTAISRSGRGGLHAVYQRPPELPATRKIKFLPGLDLLGNGYFVAPPSRITGKGFEGARPGSTGDYQWITHADVTALPQVLHAYVTTVGPTRTSTLDTSATKISTGNRNNSLFRLGAALRDHGIGETALTAALIAENERRISPPLPEAEVLQIARSVYRSVLPARDTAANSAFIDEIASLTAPITPDPFNPPDSDETPDPRSRLKSLTLAQATAATLVPVRTYPFTTFPQLNELVGGAKTRQLAVLAAPPADGKSAYAVELALDIEDQRRPDGGLPVLYVSTELETNELRARFNANLLALAWTDITEGKIPASAQYEAVAARRIHIIGCEMLPLDGGESLALVIGEIQTLTEIYGIAPFVVLDYMQDLVRSSPDEERRKVGNLAGRLRQISQLLDCPVWAVASIGREFYNDANAAKLRATGDARVYLRAAKESGDVDYAAATVIFLDVMKQEPNVETRAARIAVAKCRHGRTGVIGGRFEGRTGRWRSDDSAVILVSSSAASDAAKRRTNPVLDITDEKAILDRLAAGPLPKRHLRESCGISKDRADAAISRLLSDNRAVFCWVTQIDKLNRPKNIECIGLPSATTSANAVPTIDPVLAKL